MAYDFGYALGLESAGMDQGRSVAADSAGNVVVAASYSSESIDLDTGPGSYVLPSAGGYDSVVAKYDPLGNLLWGVHVAGSSNENASKVKLDGGGNVLLAGSFAGSVEIGSPGQLPVRLTNSGANGGFLAKLDASGNVMWATTLGTASTPRYAQGIAFDATGNVYATGTEGANAFFVAKYAAAGATVWTKVVSEGTGVLWGAYGVTSYARSADVAVDNGGNVYVTGSYVGNKVDFNPDPKKSSPLMSDGGQSDVFALKLSASGAFVWAGSMGGRGGDGGLGIALDTAGNAHINGFSMAHSEADFDPGRGKLNLPGTGVVGFVVKLDPNQNLLWGKSGVGRYGIAVDGDGAVYTTENFRGEFDADPGPGTFTLTAAGDRDVLVSKLNSAGNFVWAGAMGGPGAYLNSNGIAVDGQGNIFTTGNFRGTADFDPGAGTYSLTSALDGSGNPTSDAFVSKLVPMNALQAAGGAAPKGASISAAQVTPLQFVDSTPGDDSEFHASRKQGELTRMDSRTIVRHELGHMLGGRHAADGVMLDGLATCVRRKVSPPNYTALLDQVFATAGGPHSTAWLSAWLGKELEFDGSSGKREK